ncbi:MAG: SUMF1/EgtB/PvdO family nonheme iron enzyme [Phycisphaerales bacterium]|nr:MAG: SUMF1/EgtB/PvdO family nonheme iron enzyme [Phycisphaerales bacterium]
MTSSEDTDNYGLPEGSTEGLTATDPLPAGLPNQAANGAQSETSQRADENAKFNPCEEHSVQTCSSSPDVGEETIANPDDIGTIDPDATLNPAGRDSDETWDGDTVDPGSLTDTGSAAMPERDAGATGAPKGKRSVEQFWGDVLADLSPGHTLKNPTDAGLCIPDLHEESAEAPDLSTEGYDLLDVLGEGGVGIVYKAVQKSIDRNIAVKMAKAGVGKDANAKQKFVSEARITGRLDHPNIVPIHDLNTTPDGKPFYTMKMVRGTPWSEAIDDKPLSQNLDILLAVCDAASFAHSRQVVHRDLKPDNVMLGEFGEVQVMDWGLGAPVDSAGVLVDVTKSQAAGGTPSYMAPEMVTGDEEPVGTHSDVYLLGAILYEIVTGSPPHEGIRVLDVLQNARDNVIQPAEHDSPLVEIALKAMRTAPADRYSSVREFKLALLEYQSNAESINLCQRAMEDSHKAQETKDYETFAQALFGFRGALKLWDGNREAQAALVESQLHYGRCAFEKGDYDLAASLLDTQQDAHRELLPEIEAAQQRRLAARRRLRILRRTAVSLVAAIIIILTVASIWIHRAKQQAVIAKEEAIVAKEAAITAKQAEAEQRILAESAKTKAQEEEARAVKALTDLEQAYADLVKAQEEEKRAWAQARASELVATQTRDELAKTGMLMDNSWWVFDAAKARQAQEDAATNIAMPVELALAVADDVALEMVLIPEGEFVMGSPPKEESRAADEHLHRVSHTQPFYLSKFELTEGLWQAITGKPATPDADQTPDPLLPVTGISVERVILELLPSMSKFAPPGYEFRLPTEAEWEYACRAGTSTSYHTGDGGESLDAAGWFLSNGNRKVQPVGGKVTNAFGLHDMHGNVGEMCADQYSPGFYLESPTEDPVSSVEGQTPVVRGGSVLNTAEHCRSAYRSYVYDKNEYPFLGLRLALVPLREDTAPPQSEKQTED